MATLETKTIKESVRRLRAGCTGIVAGIMAEHLSAKRLADMGFVTGVRVRMVRPGDPCIVAIGGTFVGLGARNQECVLVSHAAAAEKPTPCCESRLQECRNGG